MEQAANRPIDPLTTAVTASGKHVARAGLGVVLLILTACFGVLIAG